MADDLAAPSRRVSQRRGWRLCSYAGIDYHDGSSVECTYSAAGDTLTRVDATGTTTYGYSQLHRLTSEVLPTHSNVYGYDPAGNLTTLTNNLPTGTQVTTYGYDAADNNTTIQEPGVAGAIAFTYNDKNLLATTTFPTTTPVVETRNYNKTVLRQIRAERASVAVRDYRYCYRIPATGCDVTPNTGVASNRISRSQDMVAGDSTAYTYDQVARLTQATTTGANPRTDAYTYDEASNRTSEQVNGGTLVTSTFTTGNQLIQRGSQTATYDANGNRISAQNGQSSPHNAKDQASSLSDSTTTLAATYAGPGMTTRTQLGTVVYYHDRLGVAAENIIPGTGTRYTRTPDGRVIGQRNAATNYYLLTDRQDSVTRVLAASGATLINWTYNPYGIRIQSTGPGGAYIPWGYHGGYHDTTGHVKMGARYYTPYTGSFLEVEPLKNPSEVRGLIDYTYAAGDPVNYSDPSGLELDPNCARRRHKDYGNAVYVLCQVEGPRDKALKAAFRRACVIFAVVTAGGAAGRAFDKYAREPVRVPPTAKLLVRVSLVPSVTFEVLCAMDAANAYIIEG